MRKILAIIAALMLTITLTAGCGTGDSGGMSAGSGGNAGGPAAIALIIGNHQNAGKPDFGSIEPWLKEAILRGGTLRAIVSDGEPYGMNAQIDNSVFQQSLTDSTRQRLLEENQQSFLAAFSSLVPKTEESDLLEAVRQAGNFLALEQTEQKVLLILDTGLSTEGLLDFSAQPDLMRAEPSDVAAALEEKHGLPNLSGTEVIMYLSQTEAPQPELSLEEQDGLARIWTEIFLASGAVSATVMPGTDSSSGLPDGYDSWPEVSVVESDGDRAIQVDLREQAEVFTEEELGFAADSDRLLNESTAKSALQPIADYMKANPERTVIIMGSTATAGDNAFCRELSERRAETAAAVLKELGGNPARIKTLGLGYEDPWHMDDLDEDGNLIESAAKKNRKVMIMDAESSEAAKLP